VTTSKTRKSKTANEGRRMSVLDAVRALLEGSRDDEVLAVVEQLVARNAELEMLLAQMRARAGHRSERVAQEQLELFLNKLKAVQEGELAKANEKLQETADTHAGRDEIAAPPKQPPVRRPPPPELRRIDNPIVVPASERPCPRCGKERTCIGHETTSVIELVPAEIVVRIDRREKLACDACESEVVRAPIGDKVVEGGAYGSRLVSDLVVKKYWESMPLNRQNEALERLGLSMPSASMSDQIQWATELLRPLWRHLLALVLHAGVMHVDGTSLPVRDRDHPNGIVTGALWGYVGDESSAAYLYTSTGKKVGQREGELGPEQFLALRKGPVVADASNLFDVSFARADLIEVGCNMHARRYFVKALEANDARAAVPIAAFKTLYDVEADVKSANVEDRLAARTERSRPVYDELVAWCQTYQPTEPPGSLLGAAVRYLLNHRAALRRYLEDGRLPIDNGIVERLHRRPAVGRRNFLFAGSHAGAERAAIAYSVIATCHLVGVNPQDYLADVLPRLARGLVLRDVPNFAPAAWKLARTTAAPPGA
jgi:transposase